MGISLEQALEIIKVSGLVAGGLWTAWTFNELKKKRTAEADLNLKLAQIQKSRLERADFDLKVVEAEHITGVASHCLAVTVTLKNEGDQNFVMGFDDSTLVVGRIVFEKDGKQTVKEVHRSSPLYFQGGSDKPKTFSGRVIGVGQRRQMVFAVPITDPGPYFVQFYAVYERVPFEDEKLEDEKHPAPVAAIEQTIHFATGAAEHDCRQSQT